jgi:hypothetical protein
MAARAKRAEEAEIGSPLDVRSAPKKRGLINKAQPDGYALGSGTGSTSDEFFPGQ